MTQTKTREHPPLPVGVEAELAAAVRTIVEMAHPRLVILFGSYAEGRAREGSDLDLLVVADTPQPRQLAARLEIALYKVLGDREFDLLVRTPEQWEDGRRIIGFVSHEADLQGVRLYEQAA